MKVGDLVKDSDGSIGIIVKMDCTFDVEVLWSNGDRIRYAEIEGVIWPNGLEVISESR